MGGEKAMGNEDLEFVSCALSLIGYLAYIRVSSYTRFVWNEMCVS